MPTNLYGPNDNYDLEKSHVIPALIRKFDEAKMSNLPSVEVWGSGTPLREFMHVDDLADACLFLMVKYSSLEFVNIGSGIEQSIKELAEVIKISIGFSGQIVWNTSKPDGTLRKLMDISMLKRIGWECKIDLVKGLAMTILNKTIQ